MRPRLAAALAVLVVAGTLVTLFGAGSEPYLVTIAVPFAVVGGLLGAKRPENPIGWLFLAFGALAAVIFLATRYAEHTLVDDPGSLPGANVAATIAAHYWHAGFGLFVFAFLLFPNGRLLSPRWRWVARAAVVVYGGMALSGPFDAEFLRSQFPRADPLVHGEVARAGSAIFGALIAANLVLLLVAGASLIVRLRRAVGDERQQVKWFVLPVAFTMVAFPLSVALVGDGRYGVWLFPLIPVSAGIAILRYRLYDIDLVIKRTLVYGALTATLAGVYVASVLLLQLALRPLTSRSDLAIAGSTLAVAAMFRPARARIQTVVDRRFFRRRYDAARTLEAFGARLRDEVDLASLGAELQHVVGETMQPRHVSLWLRKGQA